MNPAVSPSTILLVLMLSLSGCIGDEEEPQKAETDEQNAPGLGSIQGTIVTVHLDPVEGAWVRLVQENEQVAEVTTNEDGDYRIPNLEPGDYRLQTSSICCHAQVRSVHVVADETESVSFQLEPLSDDDLQIPRVERYEWTGFLACTVRAGAGANVCGLADAAGRIAGTGNVTDDDFTHAWTVGRGLKSVVGAMQWDSPGMAMGDALHLIADVDGRPNAPPIYVDASGVSPLEFRVDAGDILQKYSSEYQKYDFDSIGSALTLRYRIFAGGEANVVYQQQFTVYWDLYYWQPAPSDATALPDG